MSAKTDEPTEIKSCSTSKLNILQQAFVLDEFEMGQKEKNSILTSQIICF